MHKSDLHFKNNIIHVTNKKASTNISQKTRFLKTRLKIKMNKLKIKSG